jgi:hypothetical protein
MRRRSASPLFRSWRIGSKRARDGSERLKALLVTTRIDHDSQPRGRRVGFKKLEATLGVFIGYRWIILPIHKPVLHCGSTRTVSKYAKNLSSKPKTTLVKLQCVGRLSAHGAYLMDQTKERNAATNRLITSLRTLQPKSQ